MKMLCDTHTHSQSSHDSTAPVIDTAKACIEKGISAFAVTDHCDIQYCYEQDVLGLVKASVTETEQASKELDGKVKILKGVEIGEGIWSLEYTNKILSSFDFDVVIGSVHSVRYKSYTNPYSTIDFSKMSDTELDEYMQMYFDDVLEMLKSIPCDIMAHLTCPLRYINGKYNLNVNASKYKAQIDKILDYIIENSIAMEINTSGIGTAFGCYMPDEWIIKAFKEKGGYLVTLGSDAHTPENVGKGFLNAIELLKKHGLDSYYYYQERKPVQINI